VGDDGADDTGLGTVMVAERWCWRGRSCYREATMGAVMDPLTAVQNFEVLSRLKPTGRECTASSTVVRLVGSCWPEEAHVVVVVMSAVEVLCSEPVWAALSILSPVMPRMLMQAKTVQALPIPAV
jgi:hypothetical protein